MNKIETLKATIVNLEEGKLQYYWSSSDSCNCGVVARTLLNLESVFTNGYKYDNNKSPGVFARDAYCITTNIAIPKVFQLLKDAGFNHQELIELEYLSNKAILIRIGKEATDYGEYMAMKGLEYQKKEVVISYIKAWVEILEEENGVFNEVKVIEAPIEVTRQKTVYVSVLETITTIAEIILS